MIIARSSEGRCDGRCYKARSDKCTCICGGRNHGKELEQAIEISKEWQKTSPEGVEFNFTIQTRERKPRPKPKMVLDTSSNLVYPSLYYLGKILETSLLDPKERHPRFSAYRILRKYKDRFKILEGEVPKDAKIVGQ